MKSAPAAMTGVYIQSYVPNIRGQWLEQVYTNADYQTTVVGLTGKLDPNDDIARKLVERQHKRLKIRASSLREANFKLDEAEYCEKACLGMESFLNGGEK